jgi:quercetin dioxygenase-like cupin family protein
MTLPVDFDQRLEVRIVPPGRGDRLPLAAQDTVEFLVTGDDTQGRFTLIDFVSHPGHPGIPQHLHRTHDELWYILDGELTLRVGDELHRAAPGSTYFVPRGVPHGFRTEGQRPSHFLGLFTPAGFEGWFYDRVALLERGEATREAMAALSERYDQEMVEQMPYTFLSSPG